VTSADTVRLHFSITFPLFVESNPCTFGSIYVRSKNSDFRPENRSELLFTVKENPRCTLTLHVIRNRGSYSAWKCSEFRYVKFTHTCTHLKRRFHKCILNYYYFRLCYVTEGLHYFRRYYVKVNNK